MPQSWQNRRNCHLTRISLGFSITLHFKSETFFTPTYSMHGAHCQSISLSSWIHISAVQIIKGLPLLLRYVELWLHWGKMSLTQRSVNCGHCSLQERRLEDII